METNLRVLNRRTCGEQPGPVELAIACVALLIKSLFQRKAFMRSQTTQYLSVKELNILSDHKPIFLCLSAKSGDMSIIYEGQIPKRALFNL